MSCVEFWEGRVNALFYSLDYLVEDHFDVDDLIHISLKLILPHQKLKLHEPRFPLDFSGNGLIREFQHLPVQKPYFCAVLGEEGLELGGERGFLGGPLILRIPRFHEGILVPIPIRFNIAPLQSWRSYHGRKLIRQRIP